MNARHSMAFLGFLLILSISGPLAINFYLALLPSMAEDFSTNAAVIQQTVTLYLIGFAGAQLIVGPLSDRFGRKIVLLVCYSVFTAASLLCAIATDVTLLLAGRFVQSLGGCAGVLLSRVIVRDVYPPEEVGKVMSYLTTGFSIAPLLAPSIGGVIGVTFGWRSLFYILSLFSLVLIIWTLYGYKESNKNLNPDAIRIKHLFKNYAALLKEPQFVGYSLAVCASIAGMLTYTSASSFVLIELLGVPTTAYGLLFSISAFGLLVGSLVAAKLNSRMGSISTIWYGVLILALGGISMAILPWLGIVSVVTIVGPMFIYTLGSGIVMPTGISLAIIPFPKMAGAAAAWIGCCQCALGALCGYIVSLLYDASAIPMTLMIGLLSLVALLGILAVRYRSSFETIDTSL